MGGILFVSALTVFKLNPFLFSFYNRSAQKKTGLGPSFTYQRYDIKKLVTATKHGRFSIQRWVDEDILKKNVNVTIINVVGSRCQMASVFTTTSYKRHNPHKPVSHTKRGQVTNVEYPITKEHHIYLSTYRFDCCTTNIRYLLSFGVGNWFVWDYVSCKM